MTTGTVRQVKNGRASDGYGRVFFYSHRDLSAIWYGGEYIDLFPAGTSSRAALSGDGEAFDCFNVWNHETDTPTIERTARAFREYMDERMRTARVVTSGYPGEVWIEDVDESG